MDVQLDVTEDALWSNADWKNGFLAALQKTVVADVLVVRVLDSTGTLLFKAVRKWSVVP